MQSSNVEFQVSFILYNEFLISNYTDIMWYFVLYVYIDIHSVVFDAERKDCVMSLSCHQYEYFKY